MSSTTLLTSAQFLAMPEEYDQNGNRIKDELIAGEVVKMPPAGWVHDRIKARITRALVRYLDASVQLRLEVVPEMGFDVSERDVFPPDVSVVRSDRFPSPTRVLKRAPDIAIEVVSPWDTASHIKAKISSYLQNGASSVWIVYPDDRSVVVHFSSEVREFKGDQVIEDLLLPNFAAPVSEFFV
jgi:Uma2 family endonuclease